jgi:hypothetical protein
MNMGSGRAAGQPSPRTIAFAAVGYFGLAMCITLTFLGMRAVMDIGGACADGGPYVSVQSCPDGASAGLTLGMFGMFLFGGIALVAGTGIGGFWAGTPLLAWAALFGSLGWNFLDYGLFNPPPEAGGPIWGWLICGVVFWLMAFPPLLTFLPGFAGTKRTGTMPAVMVRPRPMSGPIRMASARSAGPATAPRAGLRITEAASERAVLRGIATAMGAAVTQAAAETPADPLARLPDGDGFAEGTQALLDRLERLADLRDRGLLTPGEFETAKAVIVAALEARA